ncbi:MAG: hypothetical protein U0271_18915 [Polyangiaceae bacterium]
MSRARSAWFFSAFALTCACSPAPEWGGGSPEPMHPDSLTGVPMLPTTQASSGPVSTIDTGPAGTAVAVSPQTTGKATYVVKPGTEHPDLQSIVDLLKPGDIVDVMGAATYPGGVRFTRDGTAAAPIVIRGVIVDGKRPVISGAADTIEAAADNYVFDGLELTKASKRCFFHHGADIVFRNGFIHDCKDGLLGADDDSGSLTVEFTEFTRSGDGVYHHQIYMATDETKHPKSVFRLQHCYIHDGSGGNNVKTRAERNEIAYNWIEGAQYHELEMVGPDGQDPKLAREDGQVVGNLFFKSNDFHTVRIGGDGTADTSGRYRFLNNTFVVAGARGAIRVFDRVESLELYNNVFYRVGGSGLSVLHESEAKWVGGSTTVLGANNWASEGSAVPSALKNTKLGSNPGFVSLAGRDFRPAQGSPLGKSGTDETPTSASLPLDDLVTRALFEPPNATMAAPHERPTEGKPSIGAFEP